jgi:hypothetical protein
MTDALTGAADAAPAANLAPISEAPANTVTPIESGGPEINQEAPEEVKSEPVKSEVSKTPDEALKKAFAKVSEKQEAKKAEAAKPVEVKAEPKTATVETDKPAQPRGEGGKFAPKEQPQQNAEPVKPSYTAGDAPKRFSDDAKAAWATVPENVRGEVARMERELTQGYEKHRASAEAYESYRELDDLAKSFGKKGADVFREYYQMEQALRKDPIGGFETLANRLGLSLRDIAAHIMGQTPEDVSSKQDATIRELRQQVEQLTQQIGGVTQTIQQQQQQATLNEVTKFAADHPRFDELADDIAFFMKSGRAKDLPEAYSLAERLNPAPQKNEPNPAPVIPAPADAHTKGTKSISGAPSRGSPPQARTEPSTTIDDALKRAFARVS